MQYSFQVELSERELFSIGEIVALWGALEHEIFSQTLARFDSRSDSELPKEMDNLQFSKVLALWGTHVVEKAKGRRKEVLQEQYKNILYYYDFRNALVHGMWDWSKSAPARITATRIRKKQVISTHFTADDLASFASALGIINFKVRYPGGRKEYAKMMLRQGAYISRLGVSLLIRDPVGDDLLRPFEIRAGRKAEEKSRDK